VALLERHLPRARYGESIRGNGIEQYDGTGVVLSHAVLSSELPITDAGLEDTPGETVVSGVLGESENILFPASADEISSRIFSLPFIRESIKSFNGTSTLTFKFMK
jgi:hypothetical protein